mgnify:CR=1 FL=1
MSESMAGAQNQPAARPKVLVPPEYCQYADGPCDQAFAPAGRPTTFFLYPSTPPQFAETIETARARLQRNSPDKDWLSWKSLPIHGQIIFCEICKAVRSSATVVADVTTLNFNLLFEIGACIALGIPVIPIRDVTYLKNTREFKELGLLDTLGYVDFQNSEELAQALIARLPGQRLPETPHQYFKSTPLYLVKGHIETEGAVQLLAAIKKSPLKFRAYDPVETPRITLHEIRRQVAGSLGVVAHLLSPSRAGSTSHNALCAFAAGLALAHEKVVIMVQEEHVDQPIDYRDLVREYSVPSQVPRLLEGPIRRIIERFQEVDERPTRATKGLLEQVDLGDTAAENEIGGLRSYFVRTGQFNQARRGTTRLVVGRKGTGKTALFYGIRDAIGKSKARVCLDLKPEGHQFIKLREAVLDKMSEGIREHTMTAFWTYILLCELARRIIASDVAYEGRDPDRHIRYERVRELYVTHDVGTDADFSQRLLLQVNRIAEKARKAGLPHAGSDVTGFVYSGDVHDLAAAVGDYLAEKEEVWLLVDNLDKGWPVKGTSSEDILVLRTLLEASRKLQRELEHQEVDLKCLVFVRTDIYDHLLNETPDKGKDTAVRLDWDDAEVFKEIIRTRVAASVEKAGSFDEIWRTLFPLQVRTQESFKYMLGRTLMRPRDLLTFLHRAIEVSINRKHATVTEDDVLQAERSYSEDMLLLTSFEITDAHPTFKDVLYAFQGAKARMERDDVLLRIMEAGLDEDGARAAFEMLVWYGFLGVGRPGEVDAQYSYEVRYNLQHLLGGVEVEERSFVVHPAFRSALGLDEK